MVLWREHYSPFGEKLDNSPASKSNDVGYTGHQFDSDTGLVYMQARYYDPVIGRFYSNDPVGFTGEVDTFNRYSYVANNPYKYVDPTGMSKEFDERQREREKKNYDRCESDANCQNMIGWWAPKTESVLVNPTGNGVRGQDVKGSGHFGASRVRNGVKGTHKGTDYVSIAGQAVFAISSGIVVRLPTGSYNGIVVGNGKGISWKILYVDVMKALKVGSSVSLGQSIGTAQDITKRYPGIINHVHVKLKIKNKLVNPALHLPQQ